MPHRVNTKGDIGTAKNASDSYDADNIYLSEEGWVYRHFKNSERTRWWDEIIVSGQVKDGVDIHGVANAPVSQTNPLKLGTDDDVGYEEGDCNFDISYANMGGTPALAHLDDMESVIIDSTDKTYDENGSYRVFEAVQGVPDGWTGVSDPSNEENYPLEPPYAGEDSFVANPNEYTTNVSSLPVPGADLEPAQVIKGKFESGAGGGYGAAQEACAGGGGGTTTIPQTAVVISPSGATTGATLVATGGGASTTTTDGETSPPVTYTWTTPGGTASGNSIVANTAGSYTVKATIPGGSTNGVSASTTVTDATLSIGAPTITGWTRSAESDTVNDVYTATVTEASNSTTLFSLAPNSSATDIYGAGQGNPVLERNGNELKVTFGKVRNDLFDIAANPFDITGVVTALDDSDDTLTVTNAGPGVTKGAFNPSVTPSYLPAGANAGTVASAAIDIDVVAKDYASEATLTVVADGSNVHSEGNSWAWTTSDGTWANVTYTYQARYNSYAGGVLNNIALDPEISGNITLTSTTTTTETAFSVNGYYPLYINSASSDAHVGGDGSSHSIVIDGATYYMPNGLTLGTDMFHGDYDSSGGSSSGGGSSYGY